MPIIDIMSWLTKFNQSSDLFSGNCGMYAIALGKKAQETRHKVTMVVCSNEESSEQLMYGESTIYHIAVEIDGVLYDGKGETTLHDTGQFAAEIYDDYQPKCSFFDLDDAFITFVRTQTNWSVPWEKYYEKISLDKLL